MKSMSTFCSLLTLNGKSLLEILEGDFNKDGGANRVYIIMFSNSGSSAIRQKNEEYR